MHLKKIHLFASIESQYGVINNFIEELANAFNRQGVISRIIHAKRDDPRAFLDDILSDRPDCTLSFNGLLPDAEGNFLCNLIKIPHVACLTDAPNHYFPLVKSPLNIITCVDHDFCQIFRDLKFPQVVFMPHAISKATAPSLEDKPLYDVLMLNSFIDYETIRQEWPKKYTTSLAKVLEEAAEAALADPNLTYMNSFIQALDKHLHAGQSIDPQNLNYASLLDDLEAYIGGKSRTDLLKSIEDVTVHVYGSHQGKINWSKYLGNKSNIKMHGPVPFTKALELMKQAKIIINATPEIKQGTHERILNGLASGAAVLTQDCPYMREHFCDTVDILLYQPQNWAEVNSKIHTYLNDDELRYHLIGKGREKVLLNHTWDQRAQLLMRELPPILTSIKNRSL